MFNVFLDSNVYITGQYDLTSGSLGYLKRYCDKGIIRLHVSPIILKEVYSHLENDVSKWIDEAERSILKHAALVKAMSTWRTGSFLADLKIGQQEIQNDIAEFISTAEVIPFEKISAVDIFNDYFDSIPPFSNEKGKKCEFPDAFVIKSIKCYLKDQKSEQELHVVSADKGWREAFDGYPGICFYENLSDLLNFVSKSLTEWADEAIAFLDSSKKILIEKTREWLNIQDWNFAISTSGSFMEYQDLNFEILDIFVKTDSAEYVDNDKKQADISVYGSALLKTHFSYIDHSIETYDREDEKIYNTIEGDGVKDIVVPISCKVTVERKSFRDFQISDIVFSMPDKKDIVYGNSSLGDRTVIVPLFR